MLAFRKLYLKMRMRMNLNSELLRVFNLPAIQPTCHNRYTDEEIKTFETIMKLERGFKKVVDACATDTDTFLLLIAQVGGYMRVIPLQLTSFS